MGSGVKGNKAELAAKLNVALPTLTQWMLRYGADFPIESRGSNGRSYVFDFGDVFDFLRAKQEEQARAAAEKDDLLAQLKLPFDVPGTEAPLARPSAKEELDAWRLRKLQREEAERAGALVPAEAMVSAISAALARLSRDTHAFLRQIGREQNWPESYVRAITARYAATQRLAVKDLDRQFGASVPAEPERLFA